MKFNGYICIYLYALYTNTISSSLSAGKFYFCTAGEAFNVKDGCENIRYKKGKNENKKICDEKKLFTLVLASLITQ